MQEPYDGGVTYIPSHLPQTIAAGGLHHLALTEQGDVLAWGDNNRGQLGDGSKRNKKRPKKIFSGPVAIAACWSSAFALTGDGDVCAWGNNFYGQCGDGSKQDKVRPVKVISEATSIAAGYGFCLAKTREGRFCSGALTMAEIISSGMGVWEIKFDQLKYPL